MQKTVSHLGSYRDRPPGSRLALVGAMLGLGAAVALTLLRAWGDVPLRRLEEAPGNAVFGLVLALFAIALSAGLAASLGPRYLAGPLFALAGGVWLWLARERGGANTTGPRE